MKAIFIFLPKLEQGKLFHYCVVYLQLQIEELFIVVEHMLNQKMCTKIFKKLIIFKENPNPFPFQLQDKKWAVNKIVMENVQLKGKIYNNILKNENLKEKTQKS